MRSDCGCSDPETSGAGAPPTLSPDTGKAAPDTAEGCDPSPLRLRITRPLNIERLGSVCMCAKEAEGTPGPALNLGAH